MIRLLLRAYPAAWRAEYGEEMRLVIFSKRITLRVLFNVLWNGYKQRMLDAGPMRTCLIGSIVTAIFAMECFEHAALVRWLASLMIIVAFNGWAAFWSRRSGKSVAQSWLVVLGSNYMANWFCATTFLTARMLIFAGARPTLALEITFLVFAMLAANVIGASAGFALARCKSALVNRGGSRMIPFLMKIYPRSWREEYGEELAQVVASKPVTAGVLFNLLCNGFRERLRSADPANVAGPCFSLLFAVLDVILIHRDASVFWLWANPLALLLALDATVVAWGLARGTTPRKAIRSALLAGVTLLAMASSMQRKTQDLSILALAAGILGAHLFGLLLGFTIDRVRRTLA